jgi:N-acetylglucosamine-6-phosphate deacetylase
MKRLSGLIARSDGSTPPGTVSFDTTIASVEATGGARNGDYILPGFIDLQVNGAGEIDVMDASADALLRLSAELAREGTVAWLPTAITAPLDRIEAVAALIAEATAAQCRTADDVLDESAQAADSPTPSATILGMHLEGPFISPARLGAHPPLNLPPRGAALERVAALAGLRMVTLAPELDGALDAISRLNASGVAVSLGHSAATLEQAQAAVAAGARMFTHTFNAMAPMYHRRPGIATAAVLPSRALAAVIADSVHVHPEMLRLLYRARGAGGICLTTDRVATGGAAPASALAGARIIDGAARMPGGTLAGSVISMLDAARMMIDRTGASAGEAALMGATNPARVLGLEKRGKIEIGARADLLVLSPALELKAVIIGGRELR